MKQHLLGTPIGRAALFLRDNLTIFRAAYLSPECVGTIANDQLATKLVASICQAHKTFVDVGAHIGSVMSEVAYLDSSIKIVAIEAIPEKAARLQRKFPFANIHACAAGETTGQVSFFINMRKSGYSSLRRLVSSNQEEISEITVPIRRLDDIVSPNDVDVIKIDVEGAELGVLRGSENIFNCARPTIMFESVETDEGNDLGYTKEALYQFLFSKEYCVLIPNRVAHNDSGLSKDGFIESHLYPRRTTNYFAIPNERRTEIRDRARSVLKICIY